MNQSACALLGVVLLSLPLAGAQTLRNPTVGTFFDNYFVGGRVVDIRGLPAVNVPVTITFENAGVRVEPLVSKVTCAGDFLAYFPIPNVPRRAQVTIEVDGKRFTRPVDTHARRTDFSIQLPRESQEQCSSILEVWKGRYTVEGRVFESTGAFQVNGTTYYSRPKGGVLVNASVIFPDGTVRPIPERLRTDSFGDFKYSFIFEENLTSLDVQLEVLGKSTTVGGNITSRISFFLVDVGDPSLDTRGTPGVSLLVFLGILLALASGRGRRL